MTAKTQQTLPLRQKLKKHRVKEEIQAELIQQLAKLLLQTLQSKEQGESRWKK